MPQYRSPGVYVEEVPSGAAPIAGVGTSTAGFIGVVADDVKMPFKPGRPLDPKTPIKEDYVEVAPKDEPQLITSWGQFKTTFGDFQSGNKTLAHAVYGFFNNGGTRCWVTRVGAAAQTGGNEAPGSGNANASVALTAASVTTALTKFELIDEIALVAVPGAQDKAIHEAVISHCENMGDRFAILDGKQKPESPLTTDTVTGGVRRSNYAALYYPWIQVFDPVSNKNDYVAPSGHLAGVYARVDAERGVHKAPANVVIRGALNVQRALSRAEQDGLNPKGINIIRIFDNNVTVWGARTLGGDDNTEWKYINVRRLFLFLRESIDEGTQWVVFEPNTPALWAQITRNVTAFLTNVWQSGALFGNTPQEAFYVKCDEETNPPAVRDVGQVVTEIGVAVVKPAEFVIFRLSQWAGSGQ